MSVSHLEAAPRARSPFGRRGGYRAALLAFALFMAGSDRAFASDGLVELDQLCAVHSGCMAGDTPGFPITITGAGGRSFILTTNLIVPGGGTNAISIDATDVSIDLNEHTILRSECVGATTDCSSTAFGAIAIVQTAPAAAAGGATVRDGRILGFGQGLLLGRGAEVRNVVTRWIRGAGISSRGHGTLLFSNTVDQCFGSLLANSIDPGGVAIGNRVSGGASFGFAVNQPGIVVVDNVALENGAVGLLASESAVMVDNVAQGNTTYGLTADEGSVVIRNTAHDNDQGGLFVQGGSLVRGNVARSSSIGPGITAAAPTGQGHLENVSSNNAGGDVVGPRVDLGANACGGTPGCP